VQARQYRWEPERVLSLLDRIRPWSFERRRLERSFEVGGELAQEGCFAEPLRATAHGDDGWQRRTLSIQ
jgi:hypothetical protein